MSSCPAPTPKRAREEPTSAAVKEEAEDPRKFKGRRVSGRVWKDTINEPVRATRKGKALHTSWAKKMERREELQRVREIDRARKLELEEARQAKREAREERLKRQKINERKAEIVQPLNPKKLKQKLKTMSKKQLRRIRKVGVDPLLKEEKEALAKM